MRFMIMVKRQDSEAAVSGDARSCSRPWASITRAGEGRVLLDASGLQPSSKGWKVKYNATSAASSMAPSPKRRN